MARVVVIGTGFGERVVAPAYRQMGWTVDICSPRDPQAIEAAVSEPCDLVSVHSPPFMHLDHVRLATAHKRNILCDKPFGRNLDEAREMLRLAREAGVLHHLNFEFRRSPLRLRIKELIESGAIGEPRHSSERSLVAVARDYPHGWLFEKGKGGWIGTVGSHLVDMIRFLFGEVATAGGQSWIDTKRRPDKDASSGQVHESTAEDAFTAWLRLENGFTATIDSSFSASTWVDSTWLIMGEKGAIEVINSSTLRLIRNGEPTVEEYYPIGEDDPHQPAIGLWIEELGKAVLEGRQLQPSFEDGVACVAVLDQIRASADAVAAGR